ncbi:MAG: TolC family protein [Planctomycetota bacterium]|jgi:outer membrane protein TolC
MKRNDVPVLLSVLVLNLLPMACAIDDAASRFPLVGPDRKAPRTADAKDAAGNGSLRETGPVRLTLTEAVLLALTQSREFAVRKFDRAIRSAGEDMARAPFDPRFRGEISTARSLSGPTAMSPPGTRKSALNDMAGTVGLDTTLPTGTTLSLENRMGWTDSSVNPNPAFSNRVGLTATQALLKGAGLGVNLATLRQARLDIRASEFELRGVAETLVAEVEKTCWDYVLAQKRIAIVSDSLKLAERHLQEVRERIRLGKVAGVEVYAAQSEVAIRREDLINARSMLDTTRVRLVRLLHLAGADRWNREITLAMRPVVPEGALDDVGDHVALASRMRTDLNQARLEIQRGELELVKTRNGLLPKLDVFISLGASGYAQSFGRSLEDTAGDNVEASAGLSFAWPIHRRDAKARHLQAGLRFEQAWAALENLSELVEVDVRTAYVEVERTREQIPATDATRVLREQTLQAETEKFRVGKSTSFQVARSQRDLLASQIAQIEAVINHLKARVDLYRLDGSLLDRRGINAPGKNPVTLSRKLSRELRVGPR